MGKALGAKVRARRKGAKRREGSICSLLELAVGRGGSLCPYWAEGGGAWGGRMKNQEVTEGVAKGGGGSLGVAGAGGGRGGMGESKREDR